MTAVIMTNKTATDPESIALDWHCIVARTSERARASGALAPIDTHVEALTEQGITWAIRVLHNVQRKKQASVVTSQDPFAPPYEQDLWVGELPPAHVVLLNKFPVIDRHVLAVTREDEPQTNLLTAADFEALLHLLNHQDGLVFYNGGTEAGSSQPHKHLQMVEFPLGPDTIRLSVASALAQGNPGNEIGRSPALPFPHARVRMPADVWDDPPAGAAKLRALYLELLTTVGLPATGPEQPGPYNVLATREWLWLVPRSREYCEGIEVNALAFAGILLVPDADRLATLKQMGIAACLRAVCP